MKHEHGPIDHSDMVKGESSLKEYLKLVAVVLAVTLFSWFLNINFGEGGWMEFMRWFMGVFFLVFSAFKFIGYNMFTIMFAGYDVIAKRFKPYSYAYPFIELGLAILYLADLWPAGRDSVTLAIMGISSVGVLQEVRRRSGVHCACLGNVIKLPLSTVSLAEDVGMGLMAFAMLVLR